MRDKQCEQCGATFTMSPLARVQRFCSHKCRAYWHFLNKSEKRVEQIRNAENRRKEKNRARDSVNKFFDEEEKIRGIIQTL